MVYRASEFGDCLTLLYTPIRHYWAAVLQNQVEVWIVVYKNLDVFEYIYYVVEMLNYWILSSEHAEVRWL